MILVAKYVLDLLRFVIIEQWVLSMQLLLTLYLKGIEDMRVYPIFCSYLLVGIYSTFLNVAMISWAKQLL